MSAATITLLFLLFAVVMFVFEKIPLGVTSMIVCIGLVVTGVLDVKTAFAGFIDSNVILFVAMFIVGGALFETGMANKIGGIVTHFAKSERSLIVAIMVIVGLMSGVLSNTGTAAVLIPVVIGIAAKSGYARSKLLMPLVFAAAMGGNLSLIGAPGNLIAQSALGEIGMSFGFFEYAIVGLPILAVGILFYATLGMKLLPIAPADAGKTVAQLLGEVEVKAPRTLVLEPGAYPPALVLANFRDKDVDTLLDLMRQAQVTIPLKAVVTPANRNWMFADLLAHLQEEHTAFTAAKESQTV